MQTTFNNVIENIDCHIKKRSHEELKVLNYIIYGAGDTGKKIARQLKHFGYNVEFLFDDYSQSDLLMPENINIYHVNDVISQKVNVNKHFVVIIATWMPVDVVQKKLTYLPDFDMMTLTELFSHFSGIIQLENILFLTSFQNYWKEKNAICQLATLWQDDISRDLYHQIWLYRLTGNRMYYPTISPGIQYFPQELVGQIHELNMIDCGAHRGDTIQQAAKLFSLCNVIAFEPDLSNFNELSRVCTDLKNQAKIKGTVLTLPCGVYNKTYYFRFDSSGNQASHLSEQGNSMIQTVSIDMLNLDSVEINFIKMDIEGAEVEALEGMQNFIQKKRPILALSAYHKPSDLLNIVFLIQAWNLNYRFYLRNYRAEGMDLIIYALPH